MPPSASSCADGLFRAVGCAGRASSSGVRGLGGLRGTYIWIADRFWYLATVIDAATKELLGWSFANHMRTELVSDAVHRRNGKIPDGVIFHSDRGTQYTSYEYALVCKMYKIRQSMGRRGVCYDNAGAESFLSTIKLELVDRYT